MKRASQGGLQQHFLFFVTHPQNREVLKAKFADKATMVVFVERLGEDIGNVEVRGDMPDLKLFGLGHVPDEVVSDVDVLGSGMEDTGVRGKGDSGLVVTPESGLLLREAEFGKKERKPDEFLGSHSACVQFGFAGGEGDGGGASRAPGNEATAEVKAVALSRATVFQDVGPGGVRVALELDGRGATESKDVRAGAMDVPKGAFGRLPVILRPVPGRNVPGEDTEGVGQVRARAHHKIHEAPHQLGVRAIGAGWLGKRRWMGGKGVTGR